MFRKIPANKKFLNPRPSKNRDEHTFSAKKSAKNWARKVSKQAASVEAKISKLEWSRGHRNSYRRQNQQPLCAKSATLWSRKWSKQASDLGDISARWSRGHRKNNNGR
ncbi:Uncharacterized protein Fot_13615 [Forsythia ovata]|uniref:Uncharacterized protein n=1 Tax=Forsythia ovata TaxID=205694 RepID=A0ABD1W490_9LAMI